MSLLCTRSPKTILLLFRYNIITTKQANCFVRPMAIVTSTRIAYNTPDGFRPPSAVSANAQRARRTGTVVSRASLSTDTLSRRNVIFVVVLFTVFVVLFFSVRVVDVITKIVSCPVGRALTRNGSAVRVAADVAPAAGRDLCRRTVSDERFPTGARKRLPGERRAVGRTTGKTVYTGRVPFGSGSRFRPVHVRNRTVCPKVLCAERCVREFKMHAIERVGRNRQV